MRADIPTLCLSGPESVGKSTIGASIAGQLSVNFVPEFAYQYLSIHSGPITLVTLEAIAKGQLEAEEREISKSENFCLFDTDLFSTVRWCYELLGGRPSWIAREAIRMRKQHYLVLTPEVPWHTDVHRRAPLDRQVWLEKYLELLDRSGCSWELVTGSYQEREQKILQAISTIRNEQLS